MILGKLQDLSWDDFRIVKMVAQSGSLSSAAERLSIDHSTIYRRLRSIETTLGAKLFDRSRKQVVTTDIGYEIVRLADQLEQGIAAFAEKMSAQDGPLSGQVLVATSDALLVYLLMPLLIAFREAYSDIQLNMMVSTATLMPEADVIIRAIPRPPPGYVGQKIGPLAWALYSRDPVHHDDDGLPSGAEWIGFGESLSKLAIAKHVATFMSSQRLVLTVNTVLGMAEAVESGVGIGYLPCFIGDSRPSLFRLATLPLDYTDDLWLLRRSEGRPRPHIEAFLDFMAAELTDYRELLAGQVRGSVPSSPKT